MPSSSSLGPSKILINSVSKFGQSFQRLSVKDSSLNLTRSTLQSNKSYTLTFLSRFILKFSVIFLRSESILSTYLSLGEANNKKATLLMAKHFISVSNFLVVNIPALVFHLTKMSSINSFFSWLMYRLIIVFQLFRVLAEVLKNVSL